MDEARLLENYLLIGALLFAIGLVGFLARRNMIVMFLAAEMMLQGVSVSLIAWGRFHRDWGGQSLVIFILAVAACEAAIALALVLTLSQRAGSLDIAFWSRVKEDHLPAFVDREIPADSADEIATFPTLTPAGREPALPAEEEVVQRGHV